ncbi:MAG: hypothetical protein IJC73_05280 [Lentisphaeria bacterium]|nr:hypothetical protein [Lentisphaeria bacterium]
MKYAIAVFVLSVAMTVAARDLRPGPIHYEEPESAPVVTETGFAAWRPDPSAAMPPDGAAARWAIAGRTLDWQPSPDPGRGGDAARIPDAALTDDGSALLLLETIGTAPGPWATRLLIFSVAAKRIVNMLRLENHRFTALEELPDDRLLLIAAGETGTTLTILELPSGQILTTRHDLPVISGHATANGKLWLKEKTTDRITIFDLNRQLESIGTITANHPGGSLAVSADGSVLLHFAADPVFYTVVGQPDTPLPEGVRPACALPLDDRAETVLIYAENAPAGLLIRGQFHPIAERAGGTAARRGETVFLGLQRQHAIALLQQPPIRGTGLQNPAPGCRPVTRGEPVRLFCDPADPRAVFVLDHRANFYRMMPPDRGRRWRKELLLTP